MKQNPNDERGPYEGWTPSADTLRRLIAIAPSDWTARLASLAVREGLFASPPIWPAEQQPDLERVAIQTGLRPPTESPDWGMLWHSVMSDEPLEADEIELEVKPPVQSESDAIEFLDGRRSLFISVPRLGIQIEAHMQDLVRAIKAEMEADALSGFKLLNQFCDPEPEARTREILHCWLTENGETGNPDRLDTACSEVESAAEFVLREAGYLRGPCTRCGRLSWLVSGPKPKGRPPLIYSYCPPCVEAKVREREAGKKRRYLGSKHEKQGD